MANTGEQKKELAGIDGKIFKDGDTVLLGRSGSYSRTIGRLEWSKEYDKLICYGFVLDTSYPDLFPEFRTMERIILNPEREESDG